MGENMSDKHSVGDKLISAIKKIFKPSPALGDVAETAKKIHSPVDGQVMPITQSADAAHQQETETRFHQPGLPDVAADAGGSGTPGAYQGKPCLRRKGTGGRGK
jgi:hypothetical protein